MYKRGFTLIELLVVITIIGILSSIVITSLNEAREGARDARRISDMKNIQVALALYYQDNGDFPCSLYNGSLSGEACTPAFFQSSYMASTPTDPNGNQYVYSVHNAVAAGSTNCNSTSARSVKYHLGAVMEQTKNWADDDWVQTAEYQLCSTCDGTSSKCGADFHGQAPACSGSTGNPNENCYDVTN